MSSASEVPRKLFLCPGCNERFNIKPPGCLRIPQLLSCAHRLCSQCFIKNQHGDRIKCSECCRITEKISTLPKDYFIIGILQNGDYTQQKTIPDDSELDVDDNSCFNCQSQAWKTCNECEKFFCDPCFQRTHESKVWRTHQLLNSQDRPHQNLRKDFCYLHGNEETLFCCDCSIQICSKCSQMCVSHKKESIRAKNMKDTNRVHQFVETISAALADRSQVLKEIRESSAECRTSTVDTIESIDCKIIDLVSFLQVLSLENKEKVRDNEAKHLGKLLQAKEILGDEIKTLMKLLGNLRFMKENISETKLHSEILKEIEKAFIGIGGSLKRDSLKPNILKFELEDNIAQNIRRSTKLSELNQKNLFPVEMTVPEIPTIPKALPVDDEESSWSDSSEENLPMYVVPTAHLYTGNANPEDWSKQPRKFMIEQHRMFVSKHVDVAITCSENFPVFYVKQLAPVYKQKEDKLHRRMQECYDRTVNKLSFDVGIGFYAAIFVESAWFRCKVVSKQLHNQKLEVFLIDTGKRMLVSTAILRALKFEFTTVKQAAIECRLVDVKTNAEPSKILEQFRKFLEDSKFKLSVSITGVHTTDNVAHVVVYFYPGNGKIINFNSLLVHELGMAESTGDNSSLESLFKNDVTCQAKKKIKNKQVNVEFQRIAVKVLNIVSPDEFYVMLKSRESDYTIINKSLELHMNSKQELSMMELNKNLGNEWKVGDSCIVEASLNLKESQFLRGKIHNLKTNSENIEVFLIDRGLKVSVEADKISKDLKLMNITPPAALRVHMAGVISTGGQSSWPMTSVDNFKHFVSEFRTKYISIVGDQDLNGSIPVVMWGSLPEKVGVGVHEKFFNVNEYMIEEGYVDMPSGTSTEKFLKLARPSSEKAFGWNSKNDEDIATLNEKTAEEFPLKTIKNWIPAETPLDEFPAIVSNIDEDGIFYVQDELQAQQLQALGQKLKKVFSKFESQGVQLKVGQPVVVSTILDGEYSRGIIEELKGTSTRIRLVDSGFTKTGQDLIEVFNEVTCEEVPVLVHQIKLASVVPLNSDDGKWPQSTLEQLREKFLGQEVKVTTMESRDEIKKCQLSFKESDVELVLEKQGLVPRHEPSEVLPQAAPKQRHFLDAELEVSSSEKKNIQANTDFMSDLPKKGDTEATLRRMDDFLARCGEDMTITIDYSLAKSSRGPIRGFQKVPPVFRDDKRHRERIISGLTVRINYYDLREAEIFSFNCEYIDYFEFLFVKPQIPQLENKGRRLKEALSRIDESNVERFKSFTRKELNFCLVQFDGCWERGKILKINDEASKIEIFLIDIARIEKFSSIDVWQLPKTLEKYPRLVLPIALHGITVNNSSKGTDTALLELLPLLDGIVLKAVVKDFDINNYPLVELFDSQGKLVYQPLIDKKLYLLN